jgi:AcrR family transcriptional regulator
MSARAEAQATTARRILDAARAAFLAAPYEDVTLARIAADAGVSHQTVLNHFSSKEGVFAAFGEALQAEIQDLRRRAVVGDPRSVIAVVVEQYERFGDTNARWDLLEEHSGEIAEAMAEARQYHRTWLEEHFAPWLGGSAAECNHRVALLYVATDVKTWKLLRRHLGHGRRTTAELMLELVEAALHDCDGGKEGSDEP